MSEVEKEKKSLKQTLREIAAGMNVPDNLRLLFFALVNFVIRIFPRGKK